MSLRRVALIAMGAWLGTTSLVRADLAPGTVLDKSNSAEAKELLPPEVLRHFERGEYRNTIINYPTGRKLWEDAFVAATKENGERLDVDAVGTVIDKTTGKQPEYLYGIPFPNIDPADPNAGVKVVWNQFLAYWNGGNSYNETLVTMLTPQGIDREIVAEGWFQFYDGQGPKYREENPHNLQSRFLGVASSPADLQGTASLNWRYRDPDKRDSVWAFVPMLRRVRQVSPANRSDGYLGSDIAADDGFFFDGKPQEFTWKLVGKRDTLRFVDPNALADKPLSAGPAPNGGWVTLTDLNPPSAGYRAKDWTGVPWAPVDPALAKRSVWVVEGVPKDKYYLYGKLELWIDAETWDGAWNRKFNWTGELLSNYQILARVTQPVGDGEAKEYLPISSMVWACSENFKMNRATLGGMRPHPKAAFYRRRSFSANLFDPQALTRFGK